MFKRDGIWWVSITFRGRRIRRSTETSSLELAKAIEAKLRTELIEGKYFDRCERKSFREMMEQFMKEHAPKVSLNMQKSYDASLKNLLRFFGNFELSAITPKKISEYKVVRYGEKVKPATINRELAMLSKAFSLAVKEWEWVRENPVFKVAKERENNRRDRWLTSEDEQMLLENSHQWLKEIIVFALHTGLRQDELLSLQWRRVDLFRKIIIIQESKNGKPRTIPLNRIALDILMEKAKVRNLKSDLVFPGRVQKKIFCQNLIKAFNVTLKKAGIENFHFHDLRHTFATRLAQRGIDLYKISKLLGHVSITMTQRYAHHCPESLRDGVEILENLGHDLVTVGKNRNVSNALTY